MANTKIPVELSSTPGIVDNSNATAITIDSSENVGIGVSPTQKLQVKAATDKNFIVLDASGVRLQATNDAGTTLDTLKVAGNPLIFLGSGGAETARIDASGNVGIGVTPTSKLDLEIDTDKRLTFSGGIGEIGNVAGFQSINSAGTALKPFGIRAEDMRFATGSSERMRIDSSGNVGIGRTDPTQLLEVHKNAGGDQTVVKFSAHNYSDTGKTYIELGTEYGDGSSRIGSFNDTGNKSVLIFETHGASSGAFDERMRIDSSGVVIVNNDSNSTGGIVNKHRSAITVGTTATNISNAATYGGLAFVWVNSGGAIAHDLVSYSLSDVDVLASQNISGGPAGRTYSASGGILKVAMSSGSYSVYATEIRASTG